VYVNEEPDTLLKHIANREVVRYLVSVDLQEVMSHGRSEATRILRDRIQAEADRHQLGASVIFVGLQDIHPPVKVAPEYEKVVAALHAKEANILSAQADAIKTNTFAQNESARIVSEAQSDSKRLLADTTAQAALFTNQIPAYLASPSVYEERAYLQAFTESITNSRKYILLATNTQDIIILNLEDKIRQDILEDLTLPPSQKR
jgi:regulator of protease activity HflC (stomatin/prohibitin superfamily)